MSNNWFLGKMGAPAQQPPTPPYTPPAPTPYNPPPSIPQEAPRMPESARDTSRCPGCGSGNYGRSALAPEAKARCYDCGYPVVQSGSGMGTGISGGTPSGPATPAKQISTANNFNPQTIIGRIE